MQATQMFSSTKNKKSNPSQFLLQVTFAVVSKFDTNPFKHILSMFRDSVHLSKFHIVSHHEIYNLAPSQNMIFIAFSLVLGGEWSESNNFCAQTSGTHTLEALQRVSKTDQ